MTIVTKSDCEWRYTLKQEVGMSSKNTQDTIEVLQRKIDGINIQIQQARDRQQDDLVAGLQQDVDLLNKEMQRLQTQLQKELQEERDKQIEEAKQQQKADDKDSMMEKLLG